ncbi:MAG: tyrosine-type recombinase/integrase [Candidatus Omnitrophica bacterium]|nr:tyrosine-type recombinase/integrase [Candidatus Omnitrophota bacterium]
MENQAKEVGLKEIADLKLNMVTEGFSERTIDVYSRYLQEFMDYLKEKSVEKLSEVTPEIINRYRIYLSLALRSDGKGKLSLITQNLKMQAVCILFRFLVREKHYLYDPTSHLRLKQPPRKRTRETLTEKEMIRLLNAPNPETPLGLRDKALLELYYSCGIRNTESRRLTVNDVNLDSRVVRIRYPKGGAGDETVPIGKVSALYLEEYIKYARPKLVQNDLEETLFLNYQGKPLSQARPARLVRKYAKIANIKRKTDAHSIRHTCATHLHDHGADVRSIQQLLRHKSLDTTQVYLEAKPSKLRKVLEKTHPRERGIVYAPPVE